MRKVKLKGTQIYAYFFTVPWRQCMRLNNLICREKNSLRLLYNVHTRMRSGVYVWFSHIQFTLGNILPATGFLSDQAHKVLGGSEGCSSLGIPQEGFPCPQKGNQQSKPWGTVGSCTDCCSTETEMADKSCCSRWILKPGQVRSPCALCWWQQEYPGWPSVHLERKRRKKQHSINLEVHKTWPLNLGNA